MEKLTIATVTYNSLQYTKFFLENLRKNANVPFRLIVVDNHSTDGTAQFLSVQKDTEVILNKRNLGFARGNNQAFRRTKTPYFLGLNNDTVVGPGFLNKILDFAEKHLEYAEFGFNSNCIGAKNPKSGKEINQEILEGDTSLFVRVQKYLTPAFAQQFAVINPGIIQIETPPNFIGGWGFLVRTEDVKKTGKLFDKRFKIGFWEDVDLSWRLAKKGYCIGLIQEAYLHHFNHVSFLENKGKLKDSDKNINRANALNFAQKWSDEIRNILNVYLILGMSLREIVDKYHIFKVFFGIREDYSDLDEKLRKIFLNNPDLNFKDFLLVKTKK